MRFTRFFFVFFLLVTYSGFAQENQSLTKTQYDVINAAFRGKVKHRVLLHTEVSKTWYLLMSKQGFNELMGPPCHYKDEVINADEIFSESQFSYIRREIINSRSFALNAKALSSNIELVDSNVFYNSFNNDSVTVISVPIIIDDFAIIKKSGANGEAIFVFQLINDNWEIICNKSTFSIIDD